MEKEYANLAFETLVEMATIYGEDDFVGTSLVLVDEKLARHCSSLYKKFGGKVDKDEFTSEYIYTVYEKLLAYDIDLDEQRALLEELNDSAYRYLFVSLKYKMADYCADVDSIRVKAGSDEKYRVQFSPISLSFLTGEDNTEVNILDVLTKENDLFDRNDNNEYFASHFADWFAGAKDSILTKSQLELLDKLNQYNLEELDKEGWLNEIGYTNGQVNSKMERIADRVLKAYKKKNEYQLSAYEKDLMDKAKWSHKIIRFANDDKHVEYSNFIIWHEFRAKVDYLDSMVGLTSDEYNNLAMDNYNSAVLYSVYDKLTTYYENALERLSQRDLSSLITEKEYYYVKKGFKEFSKGVYTILQNGVLYKKI